ncbi:aminodeoxychorismate synthase component I [Reichenbachiella versicolor]|uniref:aminodeoxychorismate synthase component I n=1 Tax=Reichenbachiella versicolor TaxID=1821036 RepID=UPI000D6DD8D9|nr:aminodeoxychorismate synthase component I [Reichenbachiella versicolor]
MKSLSKKLAISRINELAGLRRPFLFISDFSGKNNFVWEEKEIDPNKVLYRINGRTNAHGLGKSSVNLSIKKSPLPFEHYKRSFDLVHSELGKGNSYLLNLTQPTSIELEGELRDVFIQSEARYKLWFKNEFVVFSPEKFVQIKNSRISSFPMKGTIDSRIPDAKKIILSDAKEMAEHATIVDLIRNDMSKFASKVTVEDFRYVEEVYTNEKNLFQVSSKITGELDHNFHDILGDILFSLLPAGSISGAPKKKTLEIISRAEQYDRGFYTGVIGYFDGDSFDSGVLIRYIEKKNDKLIYKSGGGIHYLSDAFTEYQELIDKVYVPIR